MDENKEREASEEKEKKEKMQNQNQSVEAQRKGLIARIAGVAVSALSLIRETARTLLFGASYAKRTRDELGEKMDAVKNSAEKMQMNKIHKNTPETDLEMAKARNMQNLAEELMKDKEDTQMAETETRQEEPEESIDAKEGEETEEEETKEEDSIEETVEEADTDTEETEMKQEEIEEEEVFQIEDEFQRNVEFAKQMEDKYFSDMKLNIPPYASKIREDMFHAIKEDWYKHSHEYSQEKKDEILAWISKPKTEQETHIENYNYSFNKNVSPEIAKYINQTEEMHDVKLRLVVGTMMAKGREHDEVMAMKDSIKKAIEFDLKNNTYPSEVRVLINMSDDIHKMDSVLDKMMEEFKEGNLLPSENLSTEIGKLISECEALDGFTTEELWDTAVDAYMSGSENVKDDVITSVFFEPATDVDFEELMPDEPEQEERQQEENEQEERVNEACDAEELDR